MHEFKENNSKLFFNVKQKKEKNTISWEHCEKRFKEDIYKTFKMTVCLFLSSIHLSIWPKILCVFFWGMFWFIFFYSYSIPFRAFQISVFHIIYNEYFIQRITRFYMHASFFLFHFPSLSFISLSLSVPLSVSLSPGSLAEYVQVKIKPQQLNNNQWAFSYKCYNFYKYSLSLWCTSFVNWIHI